MKNAARPSTTPKTGWIPIGPYWVKNDGICWHLASKFKETKRAGRTPDVIDATYHASLEQCLTAICEREARRASGSATTLSDLLREIVSGLESLRVELERSVQDLAPENGPHSASSGV